MSYKYQCTDCKKKFEISPQIMLCDICGPKTVSQKPLRGVLKVVGQYSKANLDNILSFLPIEKKFFPSLHVGNSNMWKAPNLRKKFKLNNLYIKYDGSNPTGSFKDRASYLVAAFAKKHGIKEIALASTGNAASSMAGIGANAGLKITIFLPKNVPTGKLVQSLQYGANVILVDGNYDKAYDLSLEYSKKNKILSRNTAYNPLTIEGKKTASLEIVRDLGFAPDHVFVPTGDGVIIAGIYKGFLDLLSLGLIKKIPIIHAVQSSTSNAIERAYNNNGNFDILSSHTIADSICVDVPRNGHMALDYLFKYNGNVISVTDDKILVAQKELSSSTGIFTEPAGSTSYAGFLKIKKQFSLNDTIVILATGNGLKDIVQASKKINQPTLAIKKI